MEAVGYIILGTFTVCILIVVAGRIDKRRKDAKARKAAEELAKTRAKIGLLSFKASGLKRRTERLDESQNSAAKNE